MGCICIMSFMSVMNVMSFVIVSFSCVSSVVISFCCVEIIFGGVIVSFSSIIFRSFCIVIFRSVGVFIVSFSVVIISFGVVVVIVDIVSCSFMCFVSIMVYYGCFDFVEYIFLVVVCCSFSMLVIVSFSGLVIFSFRGIVFGISFLCFVSIMVYDSLFYFIKDFFLVVVSCVGFSCVIVSVGVMSIGIMVVVCCGRINVISMMICVNNLYEVSI